MSPRRLLLIHGDEVGWTDLRFTLHTMPEVMLSGEAATDQQALELATDSQPDVVFLGASIDGSSTAQLLGTLRNGPCRESLVVIFAAQLVVEQLIAFVRLGIVGYFIWNDIPLSVLRQCLVVLLSGVVWAGSRTPAVAFLNGVHLLESQSGNKMLISAREREVLSGLAEGLTRREIAARHRLSLRTVERTVERLEAKLDAHDSFVLGMRAAMLGLVP